MAFSTADRVKETTSSTGTGTIDLGGASVGFVTFASVTTSLDEVYYVIANNISGEFEVGQGVVTHGTPDTLSRSTVFASSNGGSLVDFGVGTKDVFMTVPADKIIQIDSNNDINVSADDITLTPSATGSVSVDGDFSLNGSSASFDITFDQSVNKLKFKDNVTLAIGTGTGTDGDAEIYQSGINTYWNQKGGVVYFRDNGVNDMVWSPGSLLRLYDNTALQLGTAGLFSMDYDTANTAVIFNDVQTTKDFRFQQSSSDKIIFSLDNWEFQDGVTASFGTGSDLSIEHNGTDSVIDNNTGTLFIDNSTRDIDITGRLVVNETVNLRPVCMRAFTDGTNYTSTTTALNTAATVITPQSTDNYFVIQAFPTGRFVEDTDDPGFYYRIQYLNSSGTWTLFAGQSTDSGTLRSRFADRGAGNYVQGSTAVMAFDGAANPDSGFLVSNHLDNTGNGTIQVRLAMTGVGGTANDSMTHYDVYYLYIEGTQT